MTNRRVLDGLFPPALVARAAAAWPGPEAPWVAYDTPDQRKRTLGCRRDGAAVVSDWPHVPPACRELLGRLLCLDAAALLGLAGPLAADTLLWGAGLHEMWAGDFVRPHLDADLHALTGLERRCNGVLYLTACAGGEFSLGGVGVAPAPGRLVLFETTGESVHEVTPVAGGRRLSLAAYWWSPPRGPLTRPRAAFAAGLRQAG